MILKLFSTSRRTLLAAACLALAAPAMAADAWPSRPVRLIVPYPAGGPIDGVARGLADRLSKIWHQPVLVDNRVGANEIIAADATAKSAPDGYTILLGTDPTFSGNRFLFSKLPYNPLTDLVPVTRVTFVNMAFIVSSSMRAKSLPNVPTFTEAGYPGVKLD